MLLFGTDSDFNALPGARALWSRKRTTDFQLIKFVLENYIEWKNWRPESFGKFDCLTARYFAVETGIRINQGCRVLELGFGNGEFLGWAHGIGAQVWGVEANPLLVERAELLIGKERALLNIYDKRLDDLAGTFTHVVAFDVLEHVPQDSASRLLERLGLLIGQNGIIILRFPNGDSPFGRINQHGDPTHVMTIGRAKIEYLARIAGLRTTVVRAPAMPVMGVGLSRGLRRGLLLVARRFVEILAAGLYFSGKRIPFDPNYIALLAHLNVGREALMKADNPTSALKAP